jgi:DNA-binding NarL/FixJ family response regulator
VIRVSMTDDHTLFRHGIRQILSHDHTVEVVSEFSSGWDLLDNISASPCDIFMLDISMPGPPAIELIKRLRRDYPTVPVLVLSMHSETEIIRRAIRAGAAGFVTKDEDPENLLTAIHRVARGGRYIVPCMAEKMAFSAIFLDDDEPHKLLSEREHQVLELFLCGKNNSEIAARLNLSMKTISTYKTRIMQKLDVNSDIELLRYAIKHELIPVSEF